MEKQGLLKVKEAAEYLGTTPNTIYQKAHKRQIKYVKIGRALRFRKEDLDELINENTIEPLNYDNLI